MIVYFAPLLKSSVFRSKYRHVTLLATDSRQLLACLTAVMLAPCSKRGWIIPLFILLGESRSIVVSMCAFEPWFRHQYAADEFKAVRNAHLRYCL